MTNNTVYLDPTQFTNVSSPAHVADALGAARAQLEEAQAKVKFLEGLLKHGDLNVVEGDLFRVSIARNVTQNRTDWKAVAAKLKPSRQLVQAHTKQSVYDRLTVTAKVKAAA